MPAAAISEGQHNVLALRAVTDTAVVAPTPSRMRYSAGFLRDPSLTRCSDDILPCISVPSNPNSLPWCAPIYLLLLLGGILGGPTDRLFAVPVGLSGPERKLEGAATGRDTPYPIAARPKGR